MAIAARIETQRAEILARAIKRPLTSGDRDSWTRVAQSAWGLPEINKLWDYAALTEDNIGTCHGIFDGDRMMGASIGIIKIPPEGALYLFLHQLGVDEEYQRLGLGYELMKVNYGLIENKLSPFIETLALTSDPFVARNVNLYLHKSRMHSNEYKRDFFEGIEKEGGNEHRDMPSDRFYYKAKPGSAWVKGAVYPGQQDYTKYMENHPDDVFLFDPEEVREGRCLTHVNPPSQLAFVETSVNPSVVKDL